MERKIFSLKSSILKPNWGFYLTNFRSVSRGQRIGRFLKESSDAWEGGRNKRRERTRTPPVGVILKLSWEKSLEGFLSPSLFIVRRSFAKTSSHSYPWSGFGPLTFWLYRPFRRKKCLTLINPFISTSSSINQPIIKRDGQNSLEHKFILGRKKSVTLMFDFKTLDLEFPSNADCLIGGNQGPRNRLRNNH